MVKIKCMKSLISAVIMCLLSMPCSAQSNSQPEANGNSERLFDTPEQASEALILAAEKHDLAALLEIFGQDGRDFLVSADPVHDRQVTAAFVAKAKERHIVSLDKDNRQRALLSVGSDNWPFPVPLVKKSGKWYFDSKAGREEILLRRIGANELDAIQVCRGFVEAQYEYASAVHDESGTNQYAQKILSTSGKKDGLYWENEDGTPGGPISKAVAQAIAEGYSMAESTPAPFHGYYFKILKGQGPAAPLGELDYVIKGLMIGGFALVAVPAQYGITGVRSFIVSNEGIVYEKDLGPKSAEHLKTMDRYNPDKTWSRTDDNWPAGAVLKEETQISVE